MAYQDNQRKLKEAARKIEHHKEDYHPEMNWNQGSLLTNENMTRQNDIFIDEGTHKATGGSHGFDKD